MGRLSINRPQSLAMLFTCGLLLPAMCCAALPPVFDADLNAKKYRSV